jgi:hypothetical protein
VCPYKLIHRQGHAVSVNRVRSVLFYRKQVRFVQFNVTVHPAQTGSPTHKCYLVFLYAHTEHIYTHSQKYSVRAETFVTCGTASHLGCCTHRQVFRYILTRELDGAQSRSGPFGEGKVSYPCRQSNHDSSAFKLVA